MRHDVIPLACVDWCILAAISVLAGGGGVGIGAWGGEGGEFSTDRDIQMWTEPSVGSVQSSGQFSAYLQHCAVFNVPAPYGRSVLMFQTCSQAGNNRDGLTSSHWDAKGVKGPALIIYVYSIFPLSSVTYQGQRKKGGIVEMEGVIVSGRASVSQIVMETCWDELSREHRPLVSRPS